MALSNVQYEEIVSRLNKQGSSYGLEFYPFCIEWYNSQLAPKFSLNYANNTLAFCIVSIPSFFEKGFLPFINEVDVSSLQDPLDQCFTSVLKKICLLLSEYEIDVIHDYELHPTRRPKILVQTAGHVSGAAYYYQPSDDDRKIWPNKKIFGVSLHSVYGGWFAFRGALVLRNNMCPNLTMKEPRNVINQQQKIDLLEAFNFHWQDWSYRDVSSPEERYSDLEKKYFLTKPADRFELIKNFLEK